MTTIDQAANEDVTFVSSLCLELTKHLQSLQMERSSGLRDSVFVSAVCTRENSRYQGLSEIFKQEDAGAVLQRSITRIGKGGILTYGYQLGRLCCGHKSKTNVSSVSEFREFAQLIDTGKLSDLFEARAPLPDWFQLANRLLHTLELVKFKESVLTSHLTYPAATFYSCAPVAKDIAGRITADPIFHYGWLCEELVFGSRPDFHYCYLPPGSDPLTTDKRWALCLWTDDRGSTAFETLKEQIASRITDIWRGRDPRALEREDSRKKEMDAEWASIKERAIDALETARAPEAHQVKTAIADASRAYEECSDPKFRSKFLDYVREESHSKIPLKWDLRPAIELLKEKHS